MARSLLPFVITQTDGDAVAAADVTVTLRSGGAAPIYAGETGGTQLSNPVTTDANGRIPGWLDEGSYTVRVVGATITTYTRALEVIRGDGVGKVAPGVVTNAHMVATSLTSAKILDSNVTGAKIAALQVTNAKLADDAASNRTLIDAGADEPAFATDAVTTGKLADLAVTGAKLLDATVNAAALADLGVGTTQIAASAVTTTKLLDGSVTGAKLADGVVAQEHYAANAVAPANLADSAYVAQLIMMGANTSAPSGWQICDGTAISRAGNPRLFAAIGTTYGVGDGSTTFNVPDLRGRQLVGRAAGGHPNVDNVGDNDGVGLSSRKPFHFHGPGSVSFGLGAHTHSYSAPNDGGYTAISFGLGEETWNIYNGNFLTTTINAGAPWSSSLHTHSLSGNPGDTAGHNDAATFIALHHFIRLG